MAIDWSSKRARDVIWRQWFSDGAEAGYEEAFHAIITCLEEHQDDFEEGTEAYEIFKNIINDVMKVR